VKKIFNVKTVLIAIIALILLFFTSIMNFFVEIQWFKEVGYLKVYLTRVFTKFELGVPIFIVLLIITYGYLTFLRREYTREANIIYSKGQIKGINKIILLISSIVSLLFSAIIASSSWYDILKFVNSSDFNLKDPLFNKDISFYIFKLPIYQAVYNLAFSAVILLILVTIAFYIFSIARSQISGIDDNLGSNVFRMGKRGRNVYIKEIIGRGGKKLAYLVGAVFILIGIGYIFKNYNLVYSPRGVAFGASYTDIHISLPFNRVMIALCGVAAVSVFYALFKGKAKMFAWIIGIMIGVSVIQGISEIMVEKFIVSPNAIEKEKEYIGYNIKYTRAAYDLDKIEEKEFPAEQNLTTKDIENNKATIGNIRINDFAPALEAYNQLQGIKQYYRFNDIDIDRYKINGNYTQVFISPRELDESKLEGSSQTWQNKHLYYTHGYGIAMSPVNTVTAEGQPKLVIKDIPPTSSVDVKIDRPEIYFGELTDDYIITNAKTMKELDYPTSGTDNKESVYSGKAGIKLGVLNRLLFMFNKGSLNFLLSQDIKSDSKIITNRNIIKRVEKIAPFLTYDNDPYIVANGGKLYWIIDAYTTSSLYPYSEPLGNINYIRNSVKVIIDAYDGVTNFYIIDDTDPVVQTYNKVFPGLFKTKSEIPEGFAEHFRYPEDIFNAQMEVYKKYHMTNPKVFYNKEDQWSISGESQTQTTKNSQVEPSYIVTKLPDGSNEEFILMSSYTPPSKDNMVSWLGARMDGDNYGKLIVYKFPKDKLTYGPTQFKARVNQDTTISKELSLWNQQGSSVLIGNVITVPIEKSLLYVMPVYIKSNGTSGTNGIPEMKRVVLGYGDKIVMEDTLDKALASMFNLNQPQTTPQTGETNPPASVDTNIQDIIKKANDAFLKAKEAQQKGDWAEYGARLKELEGYLNQLNSTVK
jgi:Uncharacterized conserved protein